MAGNRRSNPRTVSARLLAVLDSFSFDFTRSFNPPKRLGCAISLVNIGGFAGTLMSILLIGLVLQAVTPPGSTDYPLSAFK
jgi:hypothetical protein